tara:strand:+ start:499 stop:933 length:435 start_codon:yes stop_codon:yes gene_type:complete
MTEETDLDLELLAETVIKIREEIAKVQKEADKKINKLKQDREKIEAHLHAHCLKVGKGKSMSVSLGNTTTMLQTRDKWWTSDWNAFYEWIVENNAFDCLEKRIKQSGMRQFIEENPSDAEGSIPLPYGIKNDSSYKIVVRRVKR